MDYLIIPSMHLHVCNLLTILQNNPVGNIIYEPNCKPFTITTNQVRVEAILSIMLYDVVR